MRKLHRALVYLLTTAIIEGTSFFVMYSSISSAYSSNWTSSTTGVVAFLTYYNLAYFIMWINGFYIIPLFQLAAPVVGMFMIVAVIGEAIVGLRQARGELEDVFKSNPKLEPKYN